MLAIVLFTRGVASLVLAAWVFAQHPGWRDLFHAVAIYASIDGALGLANTVLVASHRPRGAPPLLAIMTLGDAFIRLAVGAALLVFPAIAEVPMSVVPLLGATGLTAAALGVFAAAGWAIEYRRHAHTLGYEATFDPIPAVAVVSIGVGTMLFVNPPSSAAPLGMLVAGGGLMLGIALLVASIGALLQARDSANRRGGSSPSGAPAAGSPPS